MNSIAPAPAGAFRMAAWPPPRWLDGEGQRCGELALGSDDGVVVDQHDVVDVAPHDRQRLRHRKRAAMLSATVSTVGVSIGRPWCHEYVMAGAPVAADDHPGGGCGRLQPGPTPRSRAVATGT